MQVRIAGSNDIDGVTYYDVTVSGNGDQWGVLRRYNAFAELDRRLARDASISRTALPCKDFLGIQKRFDIGRFLEKRQQGLEQYLRQLVRQPQALRNSAFAQFLEIPFSVERLNQRTSAEDGEASSQLFNTIMNTISNYEAHAERQAVHMAGLHATEEEERDCFPGIFESKYGLEAPATFQGSFAEAVAAARVEKRLVLVLLYGDNRVSDDLCRGVFAGEVFKAFVSEYFILWPGDAERWLVPAQLRQLLRLPALPSLIVLKPLSVYDVPDIADPCTGRPVEFPRDTAWSLLGAWDATSQGVDEQLVLHFLGEHGDRAAEEVRLLDEERRFQREYAEEARLLREQQDRELEESLRKDAERAKVAELEKLAAEEEKNRAAALETEKRTLAQTRQTVAAKLLEHPQLPSETCKIILRFPSGRRVERAFDPDDKLCAVYQWADCCGELSGLQGGECFEVPTKFHLATTYPRAALRDQTQSMRELQLIPNAILAFCPVEE